MAHVHADSPRRPPKTVFASRGRYRYGPRDMGCGKADVVEFHPDGTICPVEYKHGPKRGSLHQELQLCAQALCLEEMFGCAVPRGAVYSSSSHARREVDLNEGLRSKTLDAIRDIRAMLAGGNLAPPLNDARCPNCSLVHACMPGGVDALSTTSASSFLFTSVESEVAESAASF